MDVSARVGLAYGRGEMTAIKEMSRWLATVKPKPAEIRIIQRVRVFCKALVLADEHIKSVIHKAGLTK